MIIETRRALGGAHVPPTKVFRRLTASVNETIVKSHVAAAVGRKTILKPRLAAATNTFTSDFPDKKFRVAWLIRYRRMQPGSGIRTIIQYPDRAQTVRPCPDICRHTTFHPN